MRSLLFTLVSALATLITAQSCDQWDLSWNLSPDNSIIFNCTVHCNQVRPGGDFYYSPYYATNDFKSCYDGCKGDFLCLSAQYHRTTKTCIFKNIWHPLISSSGSPLNGADGTLDTVDCLPLSRYQYEDSGAYFVTCGMDRPGGHCKFS